MAPSTLIFFFSFFYLCFFFRSISCDMLDTTQQGNFPSWVKPGDRKLLQASEMPVDVVVASDGSGNYTKVMEAVLAAPDYSQKRYIIHVKEGVYNEHVVINVNKSNLMMIGDGMDATVITGDLSSGRDKLDTYSTFTVAVDGPGFIARDITFRNTAGPENFQAVALLSNSNTSVVYRCGIYGFQDSLCANKGLQFYKDCKISGSLDFIFGYAAAVFQDCNILVRKGLPNRQNTITAHGGPASPDQPFGFAFQFCNISADSDLLPFVNITQTFLGRPWHPYSRVVFMESYISDMLSPEGWLEWNGTPVNLETLYYAEYKNHGPGAGVENRVKWSGYHVLTDPSQASNFTVVQLIFGNQWLPATDVPFTPGLRN
jgi:pectinesterase